MKTYTTDPGIKLLFPVVPKIATDIKCNGQQIGYDTPTSTQIEVINLPFEINDASILGTCWRENGKLVCEGFDPASIMIKRAPSPIAEQVVDPEEEDFLVKHMKNIGLIQLDLWARREGIEIAEGEFMNVVLKVN